MKEKLPILVKGKNKIIFDAFFNWEPQSNIKIEMKSIGDFETVRSIARR